MVALAGMHVIVVGAGIGGTGAALLLAGAGAQVTVLERVAQPRAVGAGILLQANGLAVLYGLGLQAPLRQHALRADLFRITDGAGRAIMLTSAPDFGDGLDHALVLRRNDLLAILLDAVQSHPKITAHFGAEVTGVDPYGSVTYRSSNGAMATIEGDLVIGADGVHSRVREGGDFGAKVTHSGTTYVRAMSPVKLNDQSPAEAWTSLGIFGRSSVGNNDGTYFFTSARARPLASALAQRDLDAFRSAWTKAYPPSEPLLSLLQSFDELLLNEVIRVDCQRFVAGRLALLGDAAHAMHPNLGQGANSALVDAVALLEEIAKGGTLGEALARYDQRRRPAVRRVQDTAALLARVTEMEYAPVRWVRDTAARMVARLGGSERAFRAAQQEGPARLLATVRRLTGTAS